METLTDRVTRHLLTALRHHAIMATFHRAEEAGLLTSTALRGHPRSRSAWMVTDRARQVLTGSPRRDWKIIDRLLRTKGAPRYQHDTSFDFKAPEDDGAMGGFACDPPLASGSAAGARKSFPRKGQQRDGVAAGPAAGSARDIDFRYIATCLAEQLPPPNPVHVAVVLLVARAIGISLPNLAALTSALLAPAPFLLVKAPVSHFEVCLGAMLEDGLILPFKTALEDVLGGTPLSGRFQPSMKHPLRRLRTLSGKAIESTEEKGLLRRLRQSLTDEPGPVILVDETRLVLTPLVTKTADLVLECDGFDHVMIAELLQACDGTPPSHSLMLMERMDFEPDHLSLDGIALAIRPGRSLKQTLSVMAMLADRHKAGDGETDKPRSEDRQQSDSGRTGKANEKTKPPSPDIEIIEPVKLPSDTTAQNPTCDDERHAGRSRDRLLLVETLSGYGAARTWAFDLKADLALWREGNLRWDEMSTRLLLSGPPGTGKTMFARALCNTLQVPLLATSVADWLELGFLGDVLQRMSGAFAFAAEKAPSILFIDEIDNISSRQTSAANRSHDDYWTSMINRMLELLDGTSKREGVIVIGATNLPERIDPALLRSGRLETHIPIPMPDTDALVGILATHLGSDLEPVLASAPPPLMAQRLRPPPAIDSHPLRRGRPSTAPNNDTETEAAKGRHEDR